MAAGKKNKPRGYHNPNGWGMIQNVLIASLNKGQFVVGFVGFCVLIPIIKLTPDASENLIREIIEKLSNWSLVGWFLGLTTTIGWFITNKALRVIHSKEMKRVTEDKTELQQKKIGKKLSTSKK